MANKIICIGRQFGSGGHEIAVKAGAQLGIKVYERDIFRLACRFGELEEKNMEEADEKATNPYFFKTVHEGNYHVMRGLPTSEVLFALQSHEIKRLAKEESCIFVGRCADYVLKDEGVSLLRVFVSAPVEFRVQRKMEQEKLSREKAVRLVKRMDKRRAKYYTAYTGQEWGSPESYDLCIDTGRTDMEEAVREVTVWYNKMK